MESVLSIAATLPVQETIEDLFLGSSLLTILIVFILAVVLLYFIPVNLWITALFSASG